MAYLKNKEVETLNKITKLKDSVVFPFESRESFDLWFQSWIEYPIKEILENQIQRNDRAFK